MLSIPMHQSRHQLDTVTSPRTMSMPMANINKRRRRPRSTACPAVKAHRRTGMATAAAMSLLLTLLQSHPTILTTDAFTLPRSTARCTRPMPSSLTQIFQTSGSSANDGVGSRNGMIGYDAPIKSNRPLTRLTERTEVSFLQQMHDHPSDTPQSQFARQTLMLHNLPLVQSIVTKILRTRPHLVQNSAAAPNSKSVTNGRESRVGAALTRDDLLHEGTIGLAEAIDRYDMSFVRDENDGDDVESAKGGKARLGTYATFWIRARILRAIQSREHVIRFPEHVLLASHRLVKAAKEMGLEWQYVATELADYDVISVTQEKLREQLREAAAIKSDSLFREAVRVRTMSQAGAPKPLEPWMCPSSSTLVNVEEEEGSEAGQEHVMDTLSKFLIPREMEVLSLRYGLVPSADEDGSKEEVKISSDALSPQPQSFHNYEAEAEEDLFGSEGVLSHYSATPSKSIAAVASLSTKAMKNRISSFESMPSSTSSIKTQSASRTGAPALLPFKEIGKRMQFSGEYCRRTCTVAMKKLACAVEEGRLAESDFLLGW